MVNDKRAVEKRSSQRVSFRVLVGLAVVAAISCSKGDSDGDHVPGLSLLAGELVGGGAGDVDGTGAQARFKGPTNVASDGAGNLFVSDGAGIRVSDGASIRKVVIATGAVTTLPGVALSGYLASDRAGNLFFADGGTIRKVVIATGVVTTLAGSREPDPRCTDPCGSCPFFDGTGVDARFYPYPWGLASDGAGNLFVGEDYGGRIRKVVIATGVVTTLRGPDAYMGGPGPAGLASDGAGNLFWAANGTIRRMVIATGAVTTLAGSARPFGITDGTGADGTGAGARFGWIQALTSDGAGNLYVSDVHSDRTGTRSGTIRKVVIATGVVTTLAGSPLGYGSADGTGANARFTSPAGLATDGAGNLLVADSESHTIRKVVIATRVVTTLAGSPPRPSSGNASGSVDGRGANARFDGPAGLATDGRSLFVADSLHHAIRKVVIATGAVITLAGSPGDVGSADGTGAKARFNGPDGLATDGAGNLFVGDRGNQTIRKVVIATGAVTTLAGSPGDDGGGYADGRGSQARFSGPAGLASDGHGNLFVADTGNHNIRKVVVATGVVTTLAGSASAGSAGAGGGAGSAGSSGSAGSAGPAGGSGGSSGGAGSGGPPGSAGSPAPPMDVGSQTSPPGPEGSADGTGAGARFSSPWGIASDGAGNLFVADSGNHTIRKVVIATGKVTTLAGSAGEIGSTDGTGAEARFNSPGALASDGAGNLFVADGGNSTIRKIVIATGVVTTPVGVPGRAGVALGPLPAELDGPRGLAVGPTGSLFITDENAVLQVRWARGGGGTGGSAAIGGSGGAGGAGGNNGGIGGQVDARPTDSQADATPFSCVGMPDGTLCGATSCQDYVSGGIAGIARGITVFLCKAQTCVEEHLWCPAECGTPTPPPGGPPRPQQTSSVVSVASCTPKINSDGSASCKYDNVGVCEPTSKDFQVFGCRTCTTQTVACPSWKTDTCTSAVCE